MPKYLVMDYLLQRVASEYLAVPNRGVWGGEGWLFQWERVSRTFDELASLLLEVLNYFNVIKPGHSTYERHVLKSNN